MRNEEIGNIAESNVTVQYHCLIFDWGGERVELMIE